MQSQVGTPTQVGISLNAYVVYRLLHKSLNTVSTHSMFPMYNERQFSGVYPMSFAVNMASNCKLVFRLKLDKFVPQMLVG